MSKIKIAIVEDEQASRDMLSAYLHDYGTEEKVDLAVAAYPDGDSFIADYVKGKYDLVFMDICMPGTDGMSVARKLRETDSEVLLVFVTTMAKFAVEGYDVNAFKYIVKQIVYYGSMKQAEQTLGTTNFARCNYCYLVNLAFVDGVKGYDLNLSDGTVLRISQSKRKAFVQTLTKYFGGNL